jgi:hypothetical protein
MHSPKGASDFEESAVSLKRYPDTKPGCGTGALRYETGAFPQGARPALASLLCNALGRMGFDFSFIGGIQPDARYSRRFLEQIAGGARSVSSHHRTCG